MSRTDSSEIILNSINRIMSDLSQYRQRPLLPAVQPQTLTPPLQNFVPRNIFPRPPRTCVAIACEGCRKRKIRCGGSRPRCISCIRTNSECTYPAPTNDIELRRQFRRLQIEKAAYQKLIDILRSRDHREANLILDLLRQNTSVQDVLCQSIDSTLRGAIEQRIKRIANHDSGPRSQLG